MSFFKNEGIDEIVFLYENVDSFSVKEKDLISVAIENVSESMYWDETNYGKQSPFSSFRDGKKNMTFLSCSFCCIRMKRKVADLIGCHYEDLTAKERGARRDVVSIRVKYDDGSHLDVYVPWDKTEEWRSPKTQRFMWSKDIFAFVASYNEDDLKREENEEEE